MTPRAKARAPVPDARGIVHPRTSDAASLRIVSLVPSLTELLCDLGLASSMVGRTGWCVHPAGVVDAIPKIGGTKTVNVEKIRKLAPTHLVVNIDENEKPTVDALAAFVPHVVVTHPQRPEDNRALFRLMGHVFARESEADALCERFDAAWRSLMTLRDALPDRRVLYLIWKDPWMTIARDTYIASMLDAVRWLQVDVAHAATGGSRRYPAIDLVRAAVEADLVLLSSEPYRFTQEHRDEVATTTSRDARDVRLVDGERLSWYGSRAIAGLAYAGELASARAA